MLGTGVPLRVENAKVLGGAAALGQFLANSYQEDRLAVEGLFESLGNRPEEMVFMFSPGVAIRGSAETASAHGARGRPGGGVVFEGVVRRRVTAGRLEIGGNAGRQFPLLTCPVRVMPEPDLFLAEAEDVEFLRRECSGELGPLLGMAAPYCGLIAKVSDTS